MTVLDTPLSAAAVVAGRPDAYSRMLSWEAVMTRRRNMSRFQRYMYAYQYYTGENMPVGQYELPLAINYLRATCEAHASYLWGQWETQGRLINWSVRPRSGKGDQEQVTEIRNWLNDLFSGYEELMYTGGINQSVFGDCILRPAWDELTERVYPESILPEYYHARWSAHDIQDVREVIISYPIDREEAYEQWGTRGDLGWTTAVTGHAAAYAIYWEFWTKEKVEYWVDNLKVDEKQNPYAKVVAGEVMPGLIPYVHIPNVRTGGEYYGNSDIESVLQLQDELNRKMADSGDIISYNAHPIVLVRKYFGRIKDLPIGPDSIWDMGREGEAEYLSGDRPPVDIDTYIDRLLAIFQDLSYMPAAAFGRSETAQASALALAMEMMPVTQRVNWKRLQWKQGLVQYAHLATRLAAKKNGLPFTRAQFLKYHIEPQFAPVLPKDRSAVIQENVTLVTNHLRSMTKALEDMGERFPAEERDAIIKDIKELIAMGVALQLGGKNQPGPGGSPDTGAEKRDNA